MKAKITIKSSSNTEIVNIDEIHNQYELSYIDSYGANNVIYVFENSIKIEREEKDHQTILLLKKEGNSKITIITDEGNIDFDTKVLAFDKNNDMITLVYSINNENRTISIEYIRS